MARPRRRHRVELVPADAGTRLIQTEHFTGVLVPLMKKRLDTDTAAAFEAMNVALEAPAEAADRTR